MTDTFVGDNDHDTDKDHLYWKSQYELEKQQKDIAIKEKNEARRLYCEAVIDSETVYVRKYGELVPCTDPEYIAQMKGWDCYGEF